MFYIRSQSNGTRAITTDPYYIDGDVVPHTHFLTTTYLGFLGWSTTQFTMTLPAETNGYIPDGFYEIYPNFTPADGVDSLDSGAPYGNLLATLYPAFNHRIDQAWQVANVGGYIEITPASNAGYALTDEDNGTSIGNAGVICAG